MPGPKPAPGHSYSRGDLYVGEVSATRARTQGKGRHGFNMLQNFRRVPA